jgi:nucleoside-diphosphate-sugar epimerase
MKLNRTILIVGFGDVGERLAKMLVNRYRVIALVRKADRADLARSLGVTPVFGDLDDPHSLGRIGGLADIVCHFAPPPLRGTEDSRTRHLLAALHQNRALMLPQRLVYISTTGVYGDCEGDWIDETRATCPGTERAIRRVHAEILLREWGTRSGVKVSILRAPGIYARDRLPIERLQKRTPALVDADDVFTNHIHAEDLARAAMAAITRGYANRVYNAVDDTDMKMGDYFDLVADRFGLDRAPRLSRDAAAAVIGAPMMSFMRESRRIRNNRLKRELKFQLKYPTVAEFLSEIPSENNQRN